jgi:hypothetical protein
VRVFTGMLRGALDVGSRTPVAGAPAWATPKVVTGGFATGELLACVLQEHERTRALAGESPQAGSVAWPFLGWTTGTPWLLAREDA